MKDLIRAIAVLFAVSLSGGCGGIGEPGAAPATSAAPPASLSHAWDSWNWDEGGFGA